jgi:hypothetical protein
MNTVSKYIRSILDCRKTKGYAFNSIRSRKAERNMRECPQIIRYAKGSFVNEDMKVGKIDLDDFSFEVAYIVSEVLEKANISMEMSFTNKVLPTISGSSPNEDKICREKLLKNIIYEISNICAEEAKRGTSVHLSVRRGKGSCIYEFAYQNGEIINMCNEQIERLNSCIMTFQGSFSIKRIKNTHTLICLTL